MLALLPLYVFSILPVVSAHGYLKSISVNGGTSYLAWQVGQDEYVTPEPSRYARRIQDNGPVADFTTVNITCNQGGNIPAKGTIPVVPGDKVYVLTIPYRRYAKFGFGAIQLTPTVGSCNGTNGVLHTLAL